MPIDLSALGLQPGDELVSTIDASLRAKVVNSNSVEFDGKVMSLTGAALHILKARGKNPVSARGPAFWTHKGVKLTDL